MARDVVPLTALVLDKAGASTPPFFGISLSMLPAQLRFRASGGGAVGAGVRGGRLAARRGCRERGGGRGGGVEDLQSGLGGGPFEGLPCAADPDATRMGPCGRENRTAERAPPTRMPARVQKRPLGRMGRAPAEILVAAGGPAGAPDSSKSGADSRARAAVRTRSVTQRNF